MLKVIADDFVGFSEWTICFTFHLNVFGKSLASLLMLSLAGALHMCGCLNYWGFKPRVTF